MHIHMHIHMHLLSLIPGLSVTRKLSQGLGSKVPFTGHKMRSRCSRAVIMSVGEYTYNVTLSESSESTFLVAFLYSPFVL